MAYTEIRPKELPAGYHLKHTDAVGWWVDGRGGYLVTGYHKTRGAAVDIARGVIAAAKLNKRRPVWLR